MNSFGINLFVMTLHEHCLPTEIYQYLHLFDEWLQLRFIYGFKTILTVLNKVNI